MERTLSAQVTSVLFKITSESGVAAGIRRIEAVTGSGAVRWVDDQLKKLGAIASQLKSSPELVGQKVGQLVARNRELEKELATAKQALLTGGASGAAADVQEIDGIKLMVSPHGWRGCKDASRRC